MNEGEKIAENGERSCPKGPKGARQAARNSPAVGEAESAGNIGAPGLGSSIQRLDSGQFVAAAESAIAISDLHLCIFDRPQGKAQPCRLPGKQRHYIWSVAVRRFAALECLHQRFDQVGSIGGGAAEFSEKSGISPRFAAASADFYSFY